MYLFAKTASLRTILEHELIPFVAALVVAQLYFKWGSFALELVGFMAVWYVFGFIADLIICSIKK